MISWWAALSWSYAVLIVGCIAIASGIALLWALTPRESRRRDGDSSPWPLIDYSAARQRQIEWLGLRYLLARPVNRRVVR